MYNLISGSEVAPENASIPENLLARLTVGGRDAKINLDDFLSTLDILPYLEVEPAKLVTWPAHPTAIAKDPGWSLADFGSGRYAG